MLLLVTAAAAVFGATGCTVQSPSASPTHAPSAVTVDLPTHCGIRFLVLDGTWYEHVGGLLDQNGNPPAGWDNPTQVGWAIVASGTAVFHDARGHQETFTQLSEPPDSTETACA